MPSWQRINGPWGTHVADVALSDGWMGEARRRLDAARPLAALGSTTPWADQRAAIVGAWEAASNGYKAANLPPPSDPLYRRAMWNWYGWCHTTEAGQRAYQVQQLVAGNALSRMMLACDAIWASAKGAPPNATALGNRHWAMPVRVSLGSNGDVYSTCLEATGESGPRGFDCSYRGLFTGCANTTGTPPGLFPRLTIRGQYREVPCDVPYSAETFEWYDGPAGGRQSPPLRLSLDVLAELLDAWGRRGGAFEAVDGVRSYVAISNAANAVKAGLTPANFMVGSFDVEAQLDAQVRAANQAGSMQKTAQQAAITTATAVCTAASATAGPYAPVGAALCVVGGALASLGNLLIGAQRGESLTDTLGMPLLTYKQIIGSPGDPSGLAGWLAAVITMPDANGVMALDVPPVPGHILTTFEVLGGPLPMGNMQAKYRTSERREVVASSGPSPLMLALGGLALLVAVGGKGLA